MIKTIYFADVNYDIWSFYIAATKEGLIYVGSSPKTLDEFQDWVNNLKIETDLIRDDAFLLPYINQFREYLARKREGFTFSTELIGTPFQIEVWKSLLTIPYGETVTYGELAMSLNRTAAHSRAVGTAIGKNPLQIVYPCHRVGPKNGAPKGFRGGLKMKKDLLRLEGIK